MMNYEDYGPIIAIVILDNSFFTQQNLILLIKLNLLCGAFCFRVALKMHELSIVHVYVLHFQKEKEASVKNLPQQNIDSDIWVPDYLAPSWVCLPNNHPVLAIVQPGETALEVLSSVCKVGHC